MICYVGKNTIESVLENIKSDYLFYFYNILKKNIFFQKILKITNINYMNIESKKNKIIIISSPSGAGKTTICKYLLKKMNNLDLSISYTTRPIRINEINGKDYFFINNNKFNELDKKDLFIETAKNFNYLYGSPLSNIHKSFKKNRNILFDIDWKGSSKIKK